MLMLSSLGAYLKQYACKPKASVLNTSIGYCSLLNQSSAISLLMDKHP